MSDCIFCKIVNNEIPANLVYEDNDVLAFYDLEPQAPVHILVIPKMHIQSIAEITNENSNILSKIGEAISKIAKEKNLDDGFRVITNVGENGAQSVKHLHFHILGGKKLSEKIC